MKKLLKFSTPTCTVCKVLATQIEEANLDIEIEEVNAEEDVDKAIEYGVMGVPVIVLLEDEVEVNRHKGLMNAEQLKEFVK